MIGKPKIFKEAVEHVVSREFLHGIAHSEEFKSLFLKAQAFLFDELTNATEKVVGPDGVERVALRAGGRANFVRHMREFMIAEGMVEDEEEYQEVNQNDVRDIRSESRLRLIYDTNIRQAYGYGQWKQGMTPAVLRRYPAQRLVCDREDENEHSRLLENVGVVKLKEDTFWSEYLNDPAIGGFGVPYPPFGHGSGMGVRDVSREEAIKLGLNVKEIDPSEDSDFWAKNKKMKSMVKKMLPPLKQDILDDLRSYRAKDAGKAGREAGLRARKKNQ